MKNQKIQAWDLWRSVGRAYREKFKAFKLITALKRAARRPQKFGMNLFIRPHITRTAIGDIFNIILLRIQKSFCKCKLESKDHMISETKQTVKSLNRNMKKVKLRSAKANVKAFSELLKAIPRRILNTALRKLTGDSAKKMKFSIKNMVKVFVMRPKDALSKWYRFMNSCRNGDILDRVKAEKLKLQLIKLTLRTLRSAYQRTCSARDVVKGVLKNIVRGIEKKEKFAVELWKKYVFHCKKGDLLD